MAVNIGPRIGIEGEAEYRSELNKIIQTQKTLNSEMKATESAWDKDTSAKEKAKQKTQLLNQQIATQNKRIEMLQKGLSESAQKFGENDIKTLKWKQALADAQTELNKLENELRTVPSGIELVGQKFEEAGQKMQAAGQKIQSVGNTITNVGSTLTRTVTAPILAAATAAVKLGSDYEENINKVDVAFGKSAEQVKDWAKTATKNFGMSESAALDATSSFGDMATSMGLSDEEAAKMAISLAGLSGDLSSFKNIDIQSAMTALKGVFTGETESLKGLGVVMTETNLKEFAEDMGLVYNEMSQAEKVTLRYQYVMEKTANAQGDYLRTSDGFANSFRTLKAEVSNLGASFGQELLPYVTPLVQRITEIVKGFGDLDEPTKNMIMRSAGLAAAIGPVLVIGGKLVTGIGKLVEGAGNVVSWIGKIIPSFGGLSGAIAPVIGAFGLAVLGGTALGLALKDLKERFGWESQINDFNQRIRSIADAAREARGQIEKTTESLEKTTENAQSIMEEADVAADLTDRYADELYDLAGKTDRTEAEQRRLEAVVASLNKIYPGFTEAVLDSNGSLKMGTEELKSYVGELKNAAKAEALKRIVEEFTEKIVEAEMAQIEAEHALEDAREASSAAAEKKAEVEAKVTDSAVEAEGASQSYADALKKEKFSIDDVNASELNRIQGIGQMNSGLIDLEGETINAAKATEQLSDSQNMASNEEQKLADSVDESKKAVEDATSTRDEYQKQLDGLVDEMGTYIDTEMEAATAVDETAEVTSEAIDAVNDYAEETEEAAKKIRESYASAYESAKDSIMGQESLWDEYESKPATSVEAMVSALASHQKALQSWNTNASELLNSVRYATDSTFQDMVNSVIDGGMELAPQLQVIYDLWSTNDQKLEELIATYGDSDEAGDIYARNMAQSQIIAENGIAAYNEAIVGAAEEGQKTVNQKLSDMSGLTSSLQTGFSNISKVAKKYGKPSGKTVSESIASGMEDGKGDIESASGELEGETSAGIGSIIKLAIDSATAGLTVSKGIAAGLKAGRPLINIEASAVTTAVRTGISNVSGLQSSAISAGTSVARSIRSGLESESFSGVMSTLSSAVRTGIQAIESNKTSAKTAGTTIGSELAAGLDGQQSAVSSAGRRLGDSAANGVGGAQGNAQMNGRKVIDAAANELKKYEGSQEPWTWGRHLGDNFANGLESAYGNVLAKAKMIANAVSSVLKHSTPKEGPLKDDDVWGLHLGQNFAEGMIQAIPAVESAALGIADAAAMIPTATTLDIDAMTGRNVQADALTPMNITDAFIAAAENIDWKVMIGNREFGRILREQGVYA